jgi:feruloyl esterase
MYPIFTGLSRSSLLLKTAVPLLAALTFGAKAYAAASCEALKNLKLENTLITRAESISGEFRGPLAAGARRSSVITDVPAICAVEGVVSPVSGSKIGFVVWLPKTGWTQRLSMIGNGGYDSTISYSALRDIVQQGSVAVATDTGHEGGDLEFAFDHPEAIEDWGHRAGHESVVAAKAVAAAFYGNAPKYSYFNGCSTGGHQALAAAQYHPQDFDGIVAGAPGNNRSNLNLEFLWMFVQNHPDGDPNKSVVPESKLGMVHAAVVAKCDALDGVKDGVVDPNICKFDPAELTCKTDDNVN